MKITSEQSLMSEVLSKPPQKLITNGSVIIVFSLILIIALGFLIKIPDTVSAEIKIFNQQSWVEIKSANGGYIQNILVNDEESVKKDQALIVLKNSIDFKQYSELKRITELASEVVKTQKITNSIYKNCIFEGFGHFQEVYLNLCNKMSEFEILITSGEYIQKRNMIKQLLNEYELLNMQLTARVNLSDEKVKLQDKHQERMETLFAKQIIAQAEYESSLQEGFDKRDELEVVKEVLAGNELKITKLKKEHCDLEWELSNRKQQLVSDIAVINAKLISQLIAWDEQFILRTPISGSVNFSVNGSDYQYLPADVVAMTVVPSIKSEIIGRLKCSTKGAGQIEQNQKVRISLLNFPVEDYGYLWARVAGKQETPVNGKYIVNLIFPDGLKTSSGAYLDFNQYAEGNAEIYIREKSFVSQMIASFR